jgi:hypothetical protein
VRLLNSVLIRVMNPVPVTASPFPLTPCLRQALRAALIPDGEPCPGQSRPISGWLFLPSRPCTLHRKEHSLCRPMSWPVCCWPLFSPWSPWSTRCDCGEHCNRYWHVYSPAGDPLRMSTTPRKLLPLVALGDRPYQDAGRCFHAGSEISLAKAPGTRLATCHPQELLFRWRAGRRSG